MDFAKMKAVFGRGSSPISRSKSVSILLTTMMLASSPTFAQDGKAHPLQFKTVNEMIEDRGDYSEENGSFKLVSAQPLKIQLAPSVVPGDLPENVQREIRRAALYGVYRTFTHTDADAVVVKVVPMQITINPYSSKLLSSPSIQISVTRAQAMQAAGQLVDANTSSDLVVPEAGGGFQSDQWIPKFETLYIKDAGQLKLLNAIEAAGGDLVNNG